MALKKKFEISGPSFIRTNSGDVFNGTKTVDLDTYIKVESLHATKKEVNFLVTIKAGDVQLSQSSYGFAPDLEGANFIAQAYAHLKTLPEFTDAVDC